MIETLERIRNTAWQKQEPDTKLQYTMRATINDETTSIEPPP